jgi:aryl-alcohol dehydrogenase-like predicted oxidoreductase
MRGMRNLGAFTTSDLGLGCMGFSQGYGPADDAESLRAIERALDLGITLLDTAMSYGEGHNERLIGRVKRDKQVATKFGIVRDEHGVRLDGRPERVRGYCDASLKRLGVETIDLYYLHRVDPAIPVAETVGAMADLVTGGKVRHLGLSEVTPAQLSAAVKVHPIAAVQFEWSLLWRRPEQDIVPAARAHGAGIVAYSPLGRGLLTGGVSQDNAGTSDFRRSDPRFQGDDLNQNLAQVDELTKIADERRMTPAQLALAWLLAQGDDVVPIPGSRKPQRIEENAATTRLDPATVERIDATLTGWTGDRTSFAVPVTNRADNSSGGYG